MRKIFESHATPVRTYLILIWIYLKMSIIILSKSCSPLGNHYKLGYSDDICGRKPGHYKVSPPNQ